MSIFKEHQILNRKKYKNYFQIYIKTNLKRLIKRNNKKIYSKQKEIVGKDINFPKPVKNDLIINNDFKPYKLRIIKNIVAKIQNGK